MDVLASIDWGTGYPWWAIVLGAVGAAAVMSALYLAVGAQITGRLRRALQALRVVAVVAIALCLAEPMLRTAVPSSERRSVAILIDSSRSMTILDAAPKAEDGEARPRSEAALDVLGGDEGLVSTLRRDFNVSVYAIDDGARRLETLATYEPSGERTDLARSLEGVSALLDDSAAGVIVVTDGADNSGGSLEKVGAALGRRGIPVYAVGIGSAEVTDIAVTGIVARRRVTRETTVSVEVEVLAEGYAGSDLPVSITREGQSVAGARVRLEGGRGKALLEFVPARQGLVEYTVSVPTAAGEIITENNSRSFAVDVVKRKLRVLYMEGSQYKREDARHGFWEHQFLQQALVEDGMEVTSLLRDDIDAARQAGVKWVRHPTEGYPHSKKDLFAYDVIISSDIDMKFFTDEQLANTVEFVGRHGGGFVMIGGWTAFGPGGYDESVMDKMLPVDMLGRFEDYEHDSTQEHGFQWELTEEGRIHPIMQLDPNAEKNRRIWEAMPDFFGYNQVQRAKPAATVLAVHPDDLSLYGNRVILAVQPYGRGRSMAFTTDTTAGWGVKFEEEWGENGDARHFKAFWKKAVRWLAHYRLKAPAKLVIVETDRSLYQRGDRAKISASVVDSEYEPTHDAEVHLTVSIPGGESRRVELSPDFAKVGLYTAELPVTETGRYKLSVDAYTKKETLGEDSVTVAVVEPTREFTDYRQKVELLEDLAKRTNGRYFPAADGRNVSGELRESTRVVTLYKTDSIWDSWPMFLFLVAVLSTEWFLRKRAGLP